MKPNWEKKLAEYGFTETQSKKVEKRIKDYRQAVQALNTLEQTDTAGFSPKEKQDLEDDIEALKYQRDELDKKICTNLDYLKKNAALVEASKKRLKPKQAGSGKKANPAGEQKKEPSATPTPPVAAPVPAPPAPPAPSAASPAPEPAKPAAESKPATAAKQPAANSKTDEKKKNNIGLAIGIGLLTLATGGIFLHWYKNRKK